MGLFDSLMSAAGAAAPEVLPNQSIDNQEFTKEQVEQLLMAEQCGVPNTECKKHKEWPPTVMNICWNREKEGRGISCVYKAADFSTQHFPKDEKGFMFCSLDIFVYFIECFEKGIMPELPKVVDGVFDITDYKFKIAKDEMLAAKAETLKSGRIQYVEVQRWLSLEYLMCEGDDKVYNIVFQLQSWAADSAKQGNNPYANIASRGWQMMNILLGLDDMNIRGYQIPYALDYTDGSIEKLFEVVSTGRSEALCAYINKRSAQDFVSGNRTHNQIAVTHGASFCYPGSMQFNSYAGMELNLTDLNVEKYLNADIESLSVDYSKLDIKSQVDMKQGIKICEARGFKLVSKVERKRDPGESNAYCLILYNEETKDYIVADSATEKSISYGGTSLIIHRVIPIEERSATYGWNGSSGGHDDQEGSYYEFTQHDGLFRCWEQSKRFIPKNDFDWLKIGFDFYGIPIPKYFEVPTIYVGKMSDELTPDAYRLMSDMGGYYITKCVNAFLLLFDEELIKNGPSHYSLYEKWYFDCGGAIRNACWYTAESTTPAIVLSIVAEYLQISVAYLKRIEEGGRRHFAERDYHDMQQNNCGALQRRLSGNKQEKEFIKNFKQVYSKCPYTKNIVEVYGLPDPKDLPIKLPWL